MLPPVLRPRKPSAAVTEWDKACATAHEKPPDAAAPGGGGRRAMPLLAGEDLIDVDGQRGEDLVARPVNLDLAEPAVAPHVDPAVAALVHERVQPLLQQLIENLRRRLGVQPADRSQSARVHANRVDQSRRAQSITLAQIRLRPDQDPLFAPDDRPPW